MHWKPWWYSVRVLIAASLVAFSQVSLAAEALETKNNGAIVSVDRDLQTISLVPAEQGGSHINVSWLTIIDTVDPKKDIDLATEIVVSVNGDEIQRIEKFSTFVGRTKTCKDNCAACSASCFVGVPGHGCACGVLTSTVTDPQAVEAGDMIQITLAATGNGLPNSDPRGSTVSAEVGNESTIWHADEVAICPGSTINLGLAGVIRPAAAVDDILSLGISPEAEWCDCNHSHCSNCLDKWRACKADGFYTDCIPVQTPGGGTNGASCECGAARP